MTTFSIAKTCWNLVKNQQITTALTLAKQESISNPNEVEAHLLYAQILLFNGDTEEGLNSLLKSHSIEPQSVLIINQIAQTAQLLGKKKDALTFYALALQLNPSTQQMSLCGNFMLEIGQVSEAEQLLKMSSIQGNLLGVAGMINLRLRQGRTPEAADLITKHLKRLNESVFFQQAAARLMLAEKEYDSALEVLELTPLPELSKEAQIVHLRLIGEVFDKLGNIDEAFTAFHESNQLRECTYDPIVHSKHIEHIQFQGSTTFGFLPTSTCTSERPIFIVGMPRSGSSLLEQILASHPNIYGAGELDHLPTLIKQHGIDNATSLNTIAQTYLERLRQLDANSRFVTDKLPHNYQYLGSIARIFPNAKVLYCRRDPMDTGWSCYRQNFHRSFSFATDLTSIGHYYTQLTRLMTHWKKVLTLPILDVHYEQLVLNISDTIGQTLDFCDLEWDPAVLDFHNSKRIVHTASTIQVQQPLFSSSIGSAQRYNKWLQPLCKSIRP